MSLRQTLRAGAAAIAVAAIVAPAGAATTGLDVRVAQAEDFSRVEFHGAAAKLKRAGQVLTFSFPRDADPDIARLRTAPPKWIKTAEKKHVGGRLQLDITLADDADFKVGNADGAMFVNVFQKPKPSAQDAAQAAPPPAPVEPEPARPNPTPAGGVVHMSSAVVNAQVQFTFPWANPAGAAVFRRGDAVWIVFDAAANIDVSHSVRGVPQFSAISSSKGADYSAVRIEAARGTPVFATAQGATWTVSVGPGAQGPSSAVRVQRGDVEGPPGLKAAVAGATRVVKMLDPQAGDTLDVVTALGPAKGVASRRSYVQMAVLPSVQGLAIEHYVDDLNVARAGDIVHIGRKTGMALSPTYAVDDDTRYGLDTPRPAVLPSVINYQDWPKTGPKGFLDRYQHLLAAATMEGANRV